MVKYSDNEIDDLINETKKLSLDWKSKIKLNLSQKGASREGGFEIVGENQNRFRVILRQSRFNDLDFSIILGVYPQGSNKPFRLKRYDGKSHEHTNTIERETFYDFHIHTATERYQVYGNGEEDKYAQPTDRFIDFSEALKCMLADCGFIKPDNSQMEIQLFS
ncbi:hypothetical protein [Aphanothece sacrum]|uniref:Uncharacterized protein n=1 Tax=Aphanothece sacrum FPU1 TaxID=1920663 RepID=A0A401IIK7_APHSA|nr:hypothetical protein [Aphanothece sacrum]GBF81084.1 hypothetical protein AsFPU1_2494 [Aphanothece sacrum FPU1]GBF85485.1 hypothetical protein AsFPU3_2545 [Aphanothece sacrum FPU3]